MWWADIEVPNTAVDMALGQYQPVIPGVPFIRWAMAFLRTTGSLWPSFDSARLVSLTVRQAYALYERFLTVLSTFARLRYYGRRPPQSNYPPCNVLMPDDGNQLDIKKNKGYFTGDSTKADAFASMSPSYAKYVFPNTNVSCSKGAGLSLTATPHLHGEFNFTELILETAEKSLRHSCRSELTDKEFRYLRTVIVGRRCWGFRS